MASEDAEDIQVIPRGQRAKNRFREHSLDVVRTGLYESRPAVLMRCTDPGCDWRGWLTEDEATIRTAVD